MRLTARSLLIEPSFSLTRAVGRPKRPCLIELDRDQVAVLRVHRGAGRDIDLAPGLALAHRHEPAAAVRQRAEHADLALALRDPAP